MGLKEGQALDKGWGLEFWLTPQKTHSSGQKLERPDRLSEKLALLPWKGVRKDVFKASHSLGYCHLRGGTGTLGRHRSRFSNNTDFSMNFLKTPA